LCFQQTLEQFLLRLGGLGVALEKLVVGFMALTVVVVAIQQQLLMEFQELLEL
jgi:hypothetical protein